MRALCLTLGVIALGALAGCSPPTHDVAYYRAHPDVRATTLAGCRNQQGQVATNANCVNAVAADGEATSKAFWTVPKTPSRVRDPGKL